MRRRRTPTVLLLLCLALAACASLRSRDAAREREQARLDHAACVREGLAFPGDAYTTCRRRLAEARQRKHWQELTLAQQQTAQRTPDYLPTPPPGVYTPIDPTRFACAAEGAGEDAVILCRER